ncbi:MAG: hypothetical protein EXR52_00155 [Dehalococcoidia bacterium]|nr:hypothetical protein [Dehalococcoidia bacterium]
MQWTNPLGTRQVHLQVIPANSDGPDLNLPLGLQSEFEVPAPPAWYGLLLGMTYRWWVRITDQELPVPADHPTWGAWGESSFRTPSVDSSGINAVSPANGGTVTGITPTLTWAHSRPDVFYYKVQLSKDAAFNTDGVTAVASVYGALIHGGVTSPANTYTVPASAPLEGAPTYFWRVRPRVQGDGLPVPFTATFSFRTP